MKKTEGNKLDIIKLPEQQNKINIFNRNVKYLKVKDVKRAYSKLIQDYCLGLIQNDEAKTLVYMFSGYLQLIRDVEFEERLIEVEKRIT